MTLINAKQLAPKLRMTPGTIVGGLSKRPGFPKPVKVAGTRTLHWVTKEVYEWLGADLGEVDEPEPEPPKPKSPRPYTIRQALAKKLAGAQRRSRVRGRPCKITLQHLLELYEAQGERCAVSGMRFAVKRGEDGPFSPTIDRINCLAGYEPGNVRLVCLSVNLMMNKWGQSVYDELARYWSCQAIRGRDGA